MRNEVINCTGNNFPNSRFGCDVSLNNVIEVCKFQSDKINSRYFILFIEYTIYSPEVGNIHQREGEMNVIAPKVNKLDIQRKSVRNIWSVTYPMGLGEQFVVKWQKHTIVYSTQDIPPQILNWAFIWKVCSCYHMVAGAIWDLFLKFVILHEPAGRDNH